MVFETVSTFISQQFNIEENDITEDLTFDELGADEFDIAELVGALEGEFDIEIRDEEIADLSNVKKLVKLIETALKLSLR